MTKSLSLSIAFACVTLAVPVLGPTVAAADENIEFPAVRPNYPFQRSYRTGEAVVIPPYRHLFPVRVYTTPQQPPYYNVPPYPVITAY